MTVFGNLFHRKRRISTRLKVIQEKLSIRPNNFLVELEKNLRVEYAEVVRMEKEFWAMKAQILWLVEGNRNTTFYHTSALICQKRNHILFIRKGFMELFELGLCFAYLTDWDPPFWYSYLNEEEAASIDKMVTDEEISVGLWGLKPYKAPGPDGLHTGFFQHFWLVVGDTVKNEVRSTVNFGIMPEYLNKTLITLIPKCKNPES